MKKISLCLIVRNEETVLQRCLESVAAVADQIIITDTGSTDRTVAIAKKYTDEIKHFKWIDDFSAARNYCEETAIHDYILTWDADYRLEPGSIQYIQNLKKEDMQKLDLIYGRWIVEQGVNGEYIKALPKPLLYRRGKFHWVSPIHNSLVPIDAKQSVKKATLNKILFSHHKDPNQKKHRYSQTREIISRELAKDRDNPRLLFFYAEGYLFDSQYDIAAGLFKEYLTKYLNHDSNRSSSALEKIMLCNVQLRKLHDNLDYVESFKNILGNNLIYILTYADSLACIDLTLSEPIYDRYYRRIRNVTPEEFLFTDRERYLVHPRLILAEIMISQNRYEDAAILIKEIMKLSANERTLNKAKELLLHCT